MNPIINEAALQGFSLFSSVTLLAAASEAVDHQEVDALPSQSEWQVT
jgi:hypothetical protein